MKTQTVIALWILLAGSALAQSQTGIWMGVGPAPRAAVVKGAPFSADLITTNDRTDAQPGLKTEFHGKAARDSQGASYYAIEHMLPGSEGPRPMRITINDPSAQTITTLDPQQKTAFVSHVDAAKIGAPALLTPGTSSAAAPRPASVSTLASATTAEAKTEQLGTKTIEGLKVVGTRTTHTTQTAGPEGKAFVSTVETWTSPELQIVVSVENQTSNGDRHVTKLTNMVRTEPVATLFQVPAGYTVRNNAPLASNVR